MDWFGVLGNKWHNDPLAIIDIWHISVAVKALVVVMQGYQSHEQANQTSVDLVPGASCL